MNRITANRIYDLLVEHCGAREFWRDNFVYHQVEDKPTPEYRFQGKLGFGGKFWNDHPLSTRCPWSVSCYSEDATTDRLLMIKQCNDALIKLYQEITAQS